MSASRATLSAHALGLEGPSFRAPYFTADGPVRPAEMQVGTAVHLRAENYLESLHQGPTSRPFSPAWLERQAEAAKQLLAERQAAEQN